jgi:hypothetical protein
MVEVGFLALGADSSILWQISLHRWQQRLSSRSSDGQGQTNRPLPDTFHLNGFFLIKNNF